MRSSVFLRRALLLLVVLVLTACAATHPTTSPSRRVPPTAPILAPLPVGCAEPPSVVAETCPSDERATIVAAAARAIVGGTGVSQVYVTRPMGASTCALRARGFAVREADVDEMTLIRYNADDNENSCADIIVAPVDDAAAAYRIVDAHSSRPLLLVWTDEEPRWGFSGRWAHFVTPASGKVLHLVTKPAAGSRDDFFTSVESSTRAGFWPAAPGIEIVRRYDDGSADVRLLGFLRAAYVPAAKPGAAPSWTAAPSFAIASAFYPAMKLDIPPAVQAGLDAMVRADRAIDSAFGPSDSLGDDIDRTMVPAVGTCGRPWVTGAAVILRGRARVTSGRVDVDVEGIDRKFSITTWMPLRPRYDAAMKTAAKALERKDFPAAHAAVRRIHAEIRHAYGKEASFLEMDDVLGRLEGALARGSAPEGLAALWGRCRLPLEEMYVFNALRDM